jgi:hypothetical protein
MKLAAPLKIFEIKVKLNSVITSCCTWPFVWLLSAGLHLALIIIIALFSETSKTLPNTEEPQISAVLVKLSSPPPLPKKKKVSKKVNKKFKQKKKIQTAKQKKVVNKRKLNTRTPRPKAIL